MGHSDTVDEAGYILPDGSFSSEEDYNKFIDELTNTSPFERGVVTIRDFGGQPDNSDTQDHKEDIVTTFAPLQDLLKARGNTHGEYTTFSCVSQRFKDNAKDTPNWNKLPSHQIESIEMIMHKLARILTGDPDFNDHWKDIAGYATLSADRCSK